MSVLWLGVFLCVCACVCTLTHGRGKVYLTFQLFSGYKITQVLNFFWSQVGKLYSSRNLYMFKFVDINIFLNV